MEGCGNGFPCYKKKPCHMFSFTPLQGKRVQGIETEGDGEGITYRVFLSPHPEEEKRADCGVYNILFEVTILNLA